MDSEDLKQILKNKQVYKIESIKKVETENNIEENTEDNIENIRDKTLKYLSGEPGKPIVIFDEDYNPNALIPLQEFNSIMQELKIARNKLLENRLKNLIVEEFPKDLEDTLTIVLDELGKMKSMSESQLDIQVKRILKKLKHSNPHLFNSISFNKMHINIKDIMNQILD